MINKILEDYKLMVDGYLENLFSDRQYDYRGIIDAMAYSVLAGGKRIRPVLTLEFGRLCNIKPEKLLPFACAVELIHTYSLIHDDLPCMDDDDMRRGRPSCHVQFGESTALLAGDGLLTMAFELLTKSDLNDKCKIKAAEILSYNAGIHGMVGGQVLDLAHEGQDVTLEQLDKINAMKTSALIEAACLLGCTTTENEAIINAAKIYAQNLGRAFQITDDILDVAGNEEELGKPTGSDKQNQKSTYVTLLGIENCKKTVDILTKKACDALSAIDGDTEFLTQLAVYLCNRHN